MKYNYLTYGGCREASHAGNQQAHAETNPPSNELDLDGDHGEKASGDLDGS